MPESTAKSQSTVKSVIHAHQNAGDTYLLIDGNEEFIRQTGSQIISACKMRINIEVWASNFRLTLATVFKWADDRKDLIGQIFVEPRSDKIIFFVTPKSQQYDFDLGIALAGLDVTLNQSNIGYAETRQIPEWDKSTFVSNEAKLLWPHEQSK